MNRRSRPCDCEWCKNNPILKYDEDEKFESMADLLTRATFIQQQINGLDPNGDA